MRRSAMCSAMLLLVLVLTAFATPSAPPAGAPAAAAAPAPAAAESDEPPATALQHIVTTQTISFVQIAAGGSHTCGLTNTGLVYCWGWNAYGQLGDGTRTDRWTPVAVSGLSGAVAITAGAFHTCACWATVRRAAGAGMPTANLAMALPVTARRR
ncbi:MAG: hypothetical protein NZM11_08555 [Anaerolineales bacterium]|nr:hypothetical protein [Anaerolineales bacterium]